MYILHNYHYITIHYIIVHYITIHYIIVHYIIIHYITMIERFSVPTYVVVLALSHTNS